MIGTAEIKKIPMEDLDKLYDIRLCAYPVQCTSPGTRDEHIERLAAIQELESCFYGYYREGELLGSMRMYDYTMSMYGREVLVGGLGSLAVHFLHKKEQVAKELVTYFIQRYRERGASFTFLYPFRHDFYQRMGWGYGTQLYEYEIVPSSLPKLGERHYLQMAGESDVGALLACYQRLGQMNHGLIIRDHEQLLELLRDGRRQVVIYQEGDTVRGYLSYTFAETHRDNELVQNLVVDECMYEQREVLWAFCSFLSSQTDQIARIIWRTQEEGFFHLLRDPRNQTERVTPDLYHESYRAALGMMVRVIDVQQVLQEVDIVADGVVKFVLEDTFLGERTVVTVGEGSLDVTLTLDIAHFSSLLWGAVSIQKLYQYGLVQVDRPEVLDGLLKVKPRPVNVHSF